MIFFYSCAKFCSLISEFRYEVWKQVSPFLISAVAEYILGWVAQPPNPNSKFKIDFNRIPNFNLKILKENKNKSKT